MKMFLKRNFFAYVFRKGNNLMTPASFMDMSNMTCKFKAETNALNIYIKCSSTLINKFKSYFKSPKSIAFTCINTIIFTSIKFGILPWFIIPIPVKVVQKISIALIPAIHIKIVFHLVDDQSHKTICSSSISLSYKEGRLLNQLFLVASLSDMTDHEYRILLQRFKQRYRILDLIRRAYIEYNINYKELYGTKV